MTSVPEAFMIASPWYNLAFTVIAVYLFYVLFTAKKVNKKVDMRPWKLLAVAMGIFVVETILTILRVSFQLWFIPGWINGFFEIGIISIFIYTILLQKQTLFTPVKKKK